MKTFILTLLIGFSFLNLDAQVASADHSDLMLRDSSSKSKSITSKNTKTLSLISINKLSEKISESLVKNDLLRNNNTDCSLLLEISIDNIGAINSYKVSESNSKLMSKVVLELMESSDTLKLDKTGLEGVSKIKIPVRYSF